MYKKTVFSSYKKGIRNASHTTKPHYINIKIKMIDHLLMKAELTIAKVSFSSIKHYWWPVKASVNKIGMEIPSKHLGLPTVTFLIGL